MNFGFLSFIDKLMPQKYVISDLDGTLLDQIDALSSNYISDLNQLISNGMNFTIATGRDMEKAKHALPGLILKYPVVLTNGALVGNLSTNQYLSITTIQSHIVHQVLSMAEKLKITPMVFAAYDSQNKVMHFNKGKWGLKGIHALTHDNYHPFMNMDVVSIQFHTRKEILDPLKEEIEKCYHNQINIIYMEDVGYRNETKQPGWYWLELNSIDAGKANGLRKLVDLLQIDLADTIVFGDNFNDIPMLKIAGLGIAVENSPPEVKAAAHLTCGINTQGGVIKYLMQHKAEFN